MRKRLLFAFVAMCVSVSGFALEQGEFVYTPQGRFKITGVNQNANNAFQNMTGWTAIGEGKTLEDLFIVNANGLSEGFNSVVSTAATAGEGMYFKFVPTDASSSYVVSIKMKGAALVTTRTSTEGFNGSNQPLGDVLTNGVKIAGNSEHVYGGTTDELIVNKGEELTEDWQTFNYAIVGDGVSRTYFISLTHMDTNVEIADIQIAPALQFADLRQRDAMIEKLNAYKNCYDWKAGVLDEFAMNEAIENLQSVGEESGQSELNGHLETAQEVLNEFVKENMDDYLADNNDNYLGTTPSASVNKGSTFGAWTGTTTGRCFWSNGSNPELGHYQRGSKWNYNNPTSAMGIYLNRDLTVGSYVFSVEANAAMRENATQTWYINEGLKPAYGVFAIVKCNNGTPGTEKADTLVTIVKDLDPVKFTPFVAAAKIEEDGTYEVSLKAYCKEAYQDQVWGSVVYVKDASIWGKNENVYTQKQLAYEADVREQITTGRTNLDKANEYLANEEYFWGKAALQACVDTIAPKIAKYEELDQDAIIATFEEDYEKSTSAETGYLVYTIYQEAVKDILAAVRNFEAENAKLNSLQTAMDDAIGTMQLRIYVTATGKGELQTAIDNVKALQTEMKATDYSEENAAKIDDAVAELAEAVELFKTTIPADNIATLVDIDFENDAVLNNDTQIYSIAGAAGSMEFSHFSTVNPEGEDSPYQQGFWASGEQKWKGYLRVGNGDGIANFNPIAEGNEDLGTDILKISCDFYIQGLSNRSIGFFLKNEADSTLAALYRNYYDGKDTENTFGADMSKVWAKSGGSYNDASPADAEEPTATVIQKTNFEVIMDYGTQTMYCNISSPNGSTTSAPVAFTGIPVKFVLSSNYDQKFATRRAWFDNLKIQRIVAGAAVLKGDANADSEVNITDITYIIDKINNKPADNFNEEAADVNGDGEINITDVTWVLDIINAK